MTCRDKIKGTNAKTFNLKLYSYSKVQGFCKGLLRLSYQNSYDAFWDWCLQQKYVLPIKKKGGGDFWW